MFFQVWSVAISNDNDIIASGARDGVIRLWKNDNGSPLCSFNCGADIFSIKVSDDKKTIVALADKFASRKLIMLQIVHKKIRSRAPSRATSPTSPLMFQ